MFMRSVHPFYILETKKTVPDTHTVIILDVVLIAPACGELDKAGMFSFGVGACMHACARPSVCASEFDLSGF